MASCRCRRFRRCVRCCGAARAAGADVRRRWHQNATLYFDLELLSIKKDNPFGKGKASE